jgi:DNA polymerase III subunit delta'
MWNNILGQDIVKETIRSLFKAGKLSHAYLFYGNDGSGKDAAAVELAKLLNCTNIQNGDEACDECNNCKNISGFRSEYFNLVCAIPSGRSDETDSDPLEKLSAADFDAYMEQLRIKSRNPYYKINLPGANNIRINSIRSLTGKIYLTVPANNVKVFLISEADKMRQEAANALLKILEEPPAKSLLILTTSKINALPQTIAGRCQKIFFEPLSNEQIRQKLNETTSYTEKEIHLASRIASGSYSRAQKLIEIGVNELRDNAINFLISILTNDYADAVLIARNITAKNDRDRTRYFLYILNVWFNDLLHVKYESASSGLSAANADLIDRLKKLTQNYPETNIYDIIMEIEEADRLISQNVQLTLILVNLAFKLKEMIK